MNARRLCEATVGTRPASNDVASASETDDAALLQQAWAYLRHVHGPTAITIRPMERDGVRPDDSADRQVEALADPRQYDNRCHE